MHAEVKNLSDNEVTIDISAGEESLAKYKKQTLKRLQPEVSAPGFRKGKVPINLVEKQVDEKYLQSQFMDEALSGLYNEALDEHKVRPVAQPKVELGKFVPFSSLEFKVTVEVVPPITLPDYKKIKATKEEVKVTKKDVDEVVSNLKKRVAKKEPVKRAAKKGDEVVMDFSGKTPEGKDVSGASGNDYPLVLGSDSFIPGFEDELVGLKAEDSKEFTITFPKDYQHKPLAGKDVVFTINVKAVNEVVEPEEGDDLAKESGPFKNMDELREDIKKQLTAQKEQEADSKLKDEVIEKLVEKSKLEVPPSLVEESSRGLLQEFQQNLMYRGITMKEYLEQVGMSEEEHHEKEIKPQAERRVKTGLVLAEVADKEKLEVTPEELEVRMQLIRGQYGNDEQMMQQLDNPDAQREIASRLLTEKTIDALVAYATK